jgi:hypothetical protein
MVEEAPILPGKKSSQREVQVRLLEIIEHLEYF